MRPQQSHQSARPISADSRPAGGPARAYLGLEIGGSKLQVLAGDDAGTVLARWRGDVPRGERGDGVRRQVLDGLDAIRREVTPVALGVGFGGPVDRRTGRIARSYQIEGWEDFDLADWLSHEVGVPVAIENDANVAALGEATRGAGAGADPVFYATLGSGVGGGLVCQGDVYHGAPPGEAEFGHLRLDGLANATVESRCSGWAVDARIRRLAKLGPRGPLATAAAADPGTEARHLAAALAAEDLDARVILDDVAVDLAFALSHVVHLFHPQVIVLGGGLALVGEPLRAAVARELPRLVMGAFQPAPLVRLSSLGEDAVPVGAMELARRLLAGGERTYTP